MRPYRNLFSVGVLTAALAGLSACTETEPSRDVPEAKAKRSWTQEKKRRELQQAAYLEDHTVRPIATDDPSREPWYSNRLGYAWFTDSALGLNGTPYVLLRALIELYPEVWNGEGSLGNLGFGPHPEDYDPATGKLLPAEQRSPLPFGLVTAQDPAMPEDKRTDNVFFSCAACHTGRVFVKGQVRHLVGAPNTEIEAQAYAERLYLTGKAILKVDSTATPVQVMVDPTEAAKIADFLKQKVASDPAWFYGGRTTEERADNVERAQEQVARVLGNFNTALKALADFSAKTDLMYIKLASNLSYTEKDGQQSPGIFGPRPGRMDAFGLASGLVALHAKREGFFARLPDDHPFLAGLDQLSGGAKYQAAGQRLFDTAPQWMPHDPAPSDIKALWYLRDNTYANWDGNQAEEARVIASGVSSVGDPSKVDIRIHEAMNPLINDLPPSPYPFNLNLKLADQGKPLFEKECASACHFANNTEIYNIMTDMNRARQISPTARLGLLELTREACERYVEQGGNDWCRPKKGSRQADDEAYFVTPRGDKAGYKANVLHGIWAQAPYLHNGSVPTLWHLLRPAERPATFIRGNIKYDEAKVGFVWNKAPSLDEYGEGDAVHYAEHDTSLRGNSNRGHAFGSQWTDDQAKAVIEYMKTL